MVLKRKRSESDFGSVFSSTQQLDNRGFDFTAMSAMDTARRGFFAQRTTPAHLPSRTMKRFRDNRPSESEVYRKFNTRSISTVALAHRSPLARRTHHGCPLLRPAPARRASPRTITVPHTPRRRSACPSPRAKPPHAPAAVFTQLLEPPRTVELDKLVGVLSFLIIRHVAAVAGSRAPEHSDKLRGLRYGAGRWRR